MTVPIPDVETQEAPLSDIAGAQTDASDIPRRIVGSDVEELERELTVCLLAPQANKAGEPTLVGAAGALSRGSQHGAGSCR